MGYIKTGSRQFFVKKASGTSLQHEPPVKRSMQGGWKGLGSQCPHCQMDMLPGLLMSQGIFRLSQESRGWLSNKGKNSVEEELPTAWEVVQRSCQGAVEEERIRSGNLWAHHSQSSQERGTAKAKEDSGRRQKPSSFWVFWATKVLRQEFHQTQIRWSKTRNEMNRTVSERPFAVCFCAAWDSVDGFYIFTCLKTNDNISRCKESMEFIWVSIS